MGFAELARLIKKHAHADGTTPTCTGNLSAAAQTSDGAFCVNFFGLNVNG